jgi:2-oxoglutarate ferredoxin oxidoreductase subunit gamma
MHHEIIIAGFGGQGILSAGRLLAFAGMLDGREVSWLPSYGPEMRGGTANSMIVISDEPVASPFIYSCSSLVVMNNPSMAKYESYVEKNGVIVYDSSLITILPTRVDVTAFGIPATRLASEMEELSYSNVFLLGKLIERTGCISLESFEKALYDVLPKRKHHMVPEEMRVLARGMAY